MEENYEDIMQKLRKYNQNDFIEVVNKLDSIDRRFILNQVSQIDFEEIKSLYNDIGKNEEKTNSIIEPINAIDKSKLSEEEIKKYEDIGTKIIKENKFAVITMAGGQGTRLGFDGPKGAFEFDIVNHKSIFEVLCDKFKEAYNKYGVYVYWYIMTSVENNDATVEFFKVNDYFGYPKEKIIFFIQGKKPMLTPNGNLIVNEDKRLKLASDGHGGIFRILQEEKIVDEMKKEGIEWIYMGGVDNVLAKLIDPLFIGVAKDKNMLAAGKSVIKNCPEEKVGVFVKKNGRPSVVEYIEISKEMSEEKNEDGELKYGEGHILCNLFNIEVIEKTSKEKLPYHSQFKKCNYVDKEGTIVRPDKPNAYKFENFLFDVFEKLDDMVILRVKREEEFAPIKNAEGVDSPESARKLYNDYYNKINKV
ncbi:MAG: UTP--glucose-1-phosphate uridylyltransferase [Clostridia bacterium]|nr:UTP--glucose-1-phosphate uridylyltransferase [Clostridia bacterium]